MWSLVCNIPEKKECPPPKSFNQVRMASDSLGSDPMPAPEPITVARGTEPAHGPPDGDEVGIEDGVWPAGTTQIKNE